MLITNMSLREVKRNDKAIRNEIATVPFGASQ